MAPPNELENPLLRTGALVDVLRRCGVQDTMALLSSSGRTESLGYLVTMMLVRARGLDMMHAVVKNADTETNWRDLRESGVELCALSLRILQMIDRQNNLRENP